MKRTLRAAARSAATMLLVSSLPVAPSLAQTRAALTQNVDEPGRNIFVLTGKSGPSGDFTFTLPPGKRYVIELYSGACAAKQGVTVVDLHIDATALGVTATFSTASPHFQVNLGMGDKLFGGTGQGPIYADPGTQVVMHAGSATGAEVYYCNYYLSGHTIANP